MRPAVVRMVLCLSFLCGCERGCLSRWLAERGKSEQSVPPIPLNAVDCPSGLVRCIDGHVERSRAFSIPFPCNGPPEKCECPWEKGEDCDASCVSEGTALVLPAERASAVCAPSASIARPPGREAETLLRACAGNGNDEYRCLGGVILHCAEAPAAIATCARGCAVEGDTLDSEDLDGVQATALMCAR